MVFHTRQSEIAKMATHKPMMSKLWH